ncbi:MAG TPA: ABC transporter permease [Bryobacteraceae bacterium]|nr:ABC transporter permease [Bryobacteraceae bacterium]
MAPIFRWLGNFLRDLRLGARHLASSGTFAAIAAGSLALGMGGSTAMYSVVHAVILDPFPYKDVDRLVSVVIRDPAGRTANWSHYPIDQFLDIAGNNSVFSYVMASTWSDVIWTGAGEPRRLRGNHCTMNTFDGMGVPPLIGRATLPSDAAEDAEPVTLLGYRFWQREFGGDPGVLGRKLLLNGKLRTVIGVMPPRFMWRGADVYLPDVFHRGQDVEGVHEVDLLARLAPGVTRLQAQAAVRPVIADLAQRNPDDFPKNWRVELRTFKETFPSGITDALWILFGAVGLLLLIACVNVSNLLLSRAAYRRREIAIRASLGASRLRLISQLLAESLVLAAAGGALGVLVAFAGLRGIIAMTPPNTIPDEAHIAVNAPVLLFTLAVSVAAAILFGLAPALQLAGGDIVRPLKESGRGSSGGLRQRLASSLLVVGEVALSLMLLVGASLMIRTLLSIQDANLGLRPDRVLTLRIPFSDQRYPDAARRVAFLEDLLGRAASVPGVSAVGVDTGFPPIGNWTMPVEIAGASEQDNRPVELDQTSEGFAAAMGIPVVQGRFFSRQEVHDRLPMAVVNQAFVRRYFPRGEALGGVLRLPRLKAPPFRLADASFQIVGVVKDTLNRIQTHEVVPEVYIPHSLAGMADRLFVKSQGRADVLGKPLAAQVYAIDPGQPVMEIQTLDSALHDYVYSRPRFNLLLFTVFAVLGLILALSGVYGVIAHSVAQRTREIGIRLALGATFRQVIGMVMALGAKLIVAGVVLGLVGSLASVRVLSGLVQNVSTFDPYSFLAVTLLLLCAGLFAGFWPARKAARVNPVTALREE